eukprot:m.289339 g.289339  ORF g.289339 m.289339 type:complete len:73 (+) comp19967_c1_seq32:1527-1745(+)
MFWSLQPSHLPLPSTALAVSPPAPAPSPGAQRARAGGGWVDKCTATSCPTEVWVCHVHIIDRVKLTEIVAAT